MVSGLYPIQAPTDIPHPALNSRTSMFVVVMTQVALYGLPWIGKLGVAVAVVGVVVVAVVVAVAVAVAVVVVVAVAVVASVVCCRCCTGFSSHAALLISFPSSPRLTSSLVHHQPTVLRQR